MRSTISSAGPGAPPWRGPLSAASAATVHDSRSAWVEAATRAAKVGVQPVIHHRDQVGLQRPDRGGVRRPAGHQMEVGLDVRGLLRRWRNRVGPGQQARVTAGCHHQARHDLHRLRIVPGTAQQRAKDHERIHRREPLRGRPPRRRPQSGGQHACPREAATELFQLGRAGQPPVQQQEARLLERAPRRNLLVTELLRTVAEPRRARLVVGEYLRLRRPLYGFGHKIYRTRDPRAEALMRQLRAAAPGHRALEVAAATAEAVRDMVTAAPMNVDLPLAVLAAVLDLPAGASETLFIVARTAGWIAHAQEQYATGVMLRPRARYVGPVTVNR